MIKENSKKFYHKEYDMSEKITVLTVSDKEKNRLRNSGQIWRESLKFSLYEVSIVGGKGS